MTKLRIHMNELNSKEDGFKKHKTEMLKCNVWNQPLHYMHCIDVLLLVFCVNTVASAFFCLTL